MATRWTPERLAVLREIASVDGCSQAAADMLSARLGETVSRHAMLRAWRKRGRGAPVPVLSPERKEPERSTAPAVHTGRAENYLIISDLQIPYHHPGALDFCKRVRFEFSIPLENVLCVGDETDGYWASRFEKSANAPHTAEQEISESRKELARWAAAFPHMRICHSNHGNRMLRKASRDGFPRSVLKDFREVLGTPPTWQWADHWIIKASKQTFRMEHGHKGPGGHGGLRSRPLFRGMSTAWGHEITAATIHLNAQGQQVWGMCVGALTATEPTPAFEYAEETTYQACGSVGVVLDGGKLPLVVRM